MTLADLLITLKNQLWTAIEQEDRDTLSRLATTFSVLRESYSYVQREALWEMLDDLGYAAAEAAMGAPDKGKSDIPSDEKINALCRADN